MTGVQTCALPISIDTTPFARQAHFTTVKAMEPRRWEAQQRLVAPIDPHAIEPDDERGATEWALFCEVDLRGPFDDALPLVELRRVGV